MENTRNKLSGFFFNDTPLGLSKGKTLFLSFLVGLTSLVYEIYSVKVVFLYFVENTHAVAITISAFLAGLAFSALLFSKLVNRKHTNSMAMIVLMQVLIIFYALFVLRHHGSIPQLIDLAMLQFHSETLNFVVRLVVVWIFLFIPAFFLGGSFPILIGLYQDSYESRVVDTGSVYFWDTFGAIIGTLLAGFVLLPYLGPEKTIFFPVLLNFLIILLLLHNKLMIVPAVLMATVIAIPLAQSVTREPLAISPPGQKSNQFFRSNPSVEVPKDIRSNKLNKGLFGEVLFSKSSPYGAITVGNNIYGVAGTRALFINYRVMCINWLAKTEAIIGELAGELIKDSAGANVLNIGFGCGFTAQALASLAHLKKLTVVEINPTVIEASKYFKSYNNDVLDSPKVRLVNQSGQDFLRQTKDTFDSVIIDVEEPTVIHSSVLFTREYFQIIKQKLNPKGVVGLWGSFGGTKASAKVLYNTLKTVYTHVIFGYGDESSFQLFASDRELTLNQKTLNKELINGILSLDEDRINTIEDRSLEAIFDTRSVFQFPSGYSDRFVRELVKKDSHEIPQQKSQYPPEIERLIELVQHSKEQQALELARRIDHINYSLTLDSGQSSTLVSLIHQQGLLELFDYIKNKRGPDRVTVLEYELQNGNEDMAITLLRWGVDSMPIDSDFPPYSRAIRYQRWKFLDKIKNYSDQWGNNLLSHAVGIYVNESDALALLRLGVSPYTRIVVQGARPNETLLTLAQTNKMSRLVSELQKTPEYFQGKI